MLAPQQSARSQTANPPSRPLQERNCLSPIVIIDHLQANLNPQPEELRRDPNQLDLKQTSRMHPAEKCTGQVLDSNTLTESVEIQLSVHRPEIQHPAMQQRQQSEQVRAAPIRKRREPGTMRELKWLNAHLPEGRLRRKRKPSAKSAAAEETVVVLSKRRRLLKVRSLPTVNLL